MKKLEMSTKRVALDKTNAQVMIIVAVACFVTIFCLFAAKTVLSGNMYRSKVVSAKEDARNQLDSNLESFNKLQTAYNAWDGASQNIIGGVKDGTADNDGSNSKIILDGLPSKYDFPALASSIEKMVRGLNLQVSGIDGVDDEVNQQNNTSSPNPQVVEMPFTFTVENANYDSVQKLISELQRSIRPIHIDNISFSGSNQSLTVSVQAHSYYQPAKNVEPQKRTVK